MTGWIGGASRMDLSVSTMVNNTRETANKNIIIIYYCVQPAHTWYQQVTNDQNQYNVPMWLFCDVVVIFQWHRQMYTIC